MRSVVRLSRLLLLFASLTVSLSATNAQDFGINATLEPNTISENDVATLTVEISGDNQNLPSPDIARSNDYEIYSQGRSTSVQIINGVITATNIYRFQIQPKKTGTLLIDGISATANGRSVRANPLPLTVHAGGAAPTQNQTPNETRSGENKDYFLEASVDTKNPYVGQQVTYTIRFYFAVQLYDGPSLTEPTKNGFWSEVLNNKPPETKRINGRLYRVLERTEALFPTQAGELEIGRAQITATVQSRTRQSRDPFDIFGGMIGGGEQITVRSNPVRLNVRSLPDSGRPDNFSGVVGNMTLTVDVDRTEVVINQPITLKVRIVGEGNIKSIAEPEIPTSPSYSSYLSKTNESVNKQGDRLGGSRDYEFAIIPRRAGQLEFQPLRYTFFNPRSGTYEALTSRAFTFNVLPGTGDPNAPDGMPIPGPNEQVGSLAGDVRYIKSDPGTLHTIGAHPIWNTPVVLTHVIALMLLGSSIVVRSQKNRMASDPAGSRARAAAQVARKRLAAANAVMNPSTAQKFYAEIRLALTSFIADKVNRSAHGLTDAQVIDLLKERGVSDEIIVTILKVFRECDASRFGSQVVSLDTMRTTYEKAEGILKQLQEIKFVHVA